MPKDLFTAAANIVFSNIFQFRDLAKTPAGLGQPASPYATTFDGAVQV